MAGIRYVHDVHAALRSAGKVREEEGIDIADTQKSEMPPGAAPGAICRCSF
jgi:hypothetical protein